MITPPPFGFSMDILADILFFVIFVIVPWMRRRKQQQEAAEDGPEELLEESLEAPEPTPAARVREVLSGGGSLGDVGDALRESIQAKIREHVPEELVQDPAPSPEQTDRIREGWQRLEERLAGIHVPAHDDRMVACMERLVVHLESTRDVVLEGVDGSSPGDRLAMLRREMERMGAVERIVTSRHRAMQWKRMLRGDRLHAGWFEPLTLGDAPWSPWIYVAVPAEMPPGVCELVAELDVMALPIPEDPDDPEAWALQAREHLGRLGLRSSRGARALRGAVMQLAPGSVNVLPPGATGTIEVSDVDNLVHAWAPILVLDQLAGWLVGPSLLEAWVHGGLPGAEADRIDVDFWGGRIHSLPPEHVRVQALAHGWSLRNREDLARRARGTWMEFQGDPGTLRLVLDGDRSAAIPSEFFLDRALDFVALVQRVPLGFLGGRVLMEEGAWEAVGLDDAPSAPAGGLSSAEPALAYASAMEAWMRREVASRTFWAALDGEVAMQEAPAVEREPATGEPELSSPSTAPEDWRVGWVLNAILGPPPGLRRRSPLHRSRAFVRGP